MALVLNLETGLVSPQFHVVFDPSFQTIKKSFGGNPPKSQWQVKCGFSDEGHTVQAPPARARRTRRLVEVGEGTEQLPVDIQPQPSEQREQRDDPEPADEETESESDSDSHTEPHDSRLRTQVYQERQVHPTTTTRSGRIVRAPQRLVRAMVTLLMATTTVSEGANSDIRSSQPVPGELFCMQALFPEDEVIMDTHPLLAYGATNDPDTLYYHEAMKAPDRPQFLVSMEKEFNNQLKNENFEIIHGSLVPEGERILPAVWAMRRKRKTLTNEVY